MIPHFKTWYRRRVLRNELVPEEVWRGTVTRLRFLRGMRPDELERLRELATLFLHAKQINGARGLCITDDMRVLIAAQACILILNLGLDYYEGWVEVIVYPGEFIRDYEYVDEDGIVHHGSEPVSGESWLGGPVILSWEDTAAAEPGTGYNVVIHEFAHKLDMLNGDANGFPPLHADMSRWAWTEAFSKAYTDFCCGLEENDATEVDPYAAESPAEFFAVMSEVFFGAPFAIKTRYPAAYEQLALFYRQDPAQRWNES